MEPVCGINFLAECLINAGFTRDLANLLTTLGGVVLVATVPLVTVIFLIWTERKIAARVQDRIGPNRVGPFGLLQTVADAVKMLTKEDITPTGADKFIYNLAPIISFASVILMWAVVPFTPLHIGADLSVGALYFVAVASIGTIKVMIAGWSSNNKYALLGAFRTIAQLLSYEVPMVLSLIIPVMLAGTLSMQEIVWEQGAMWYVFMAPIAFVMFFVANLAETGRAPFDLLEAESEIIAGYNIEYSGFKWGMFMAGEFMHVFTACLFAAVLFLGGWWGPFVNEIPVLGFIYLGLKTSVIYIFSLILRSTVPRVRIDQLMAFNWRWLVPISVGVLLMTAFLLQVIKSLGLQPQGDFISALPQTIILFLGNVVIGLIVVNAVRNRGRTLRQIQSESRAIVVHGHEETLPAPAGD
jgi:NADH-quinone oxidoreductase subunit H